MYKNYFITTFRQLYKQKASSLINVFGIAIGLSVCLFLLQYISFEKSFDRFNVNSEQICRVHSVWPMAGGANDVWATSTFSYGPVLKTNSQDVLDYTRIYLFESERVFEYKSEGVMFREQNVFMADSSIFNFFNFPLLVGNPSEVLKTPNSVVLSERMARKIFNNENPVGKNLSISNRSESFDCNVTGIFKDLPSNSHLQFDVLISLETIVSTRYKPRGANINNDWGHHLSYTYLLIRPGASVEKIEAEFNEVVKSYAQRIGFVGEDWAVKLEPLEEIHLAPKLALENEKKGNPLAIKSLTIMAIIVLIIAWINYINLAIVRAIKRSSEISIRKVFGERKKDIFKIMSIEAFVFTFLGACSSLLLLKFLVLLLQSFGFYSNFPIFSSTQFWFFFFFANCLSIILLGFIPSLFILKLQSANNSVGRMRLDDKGILFRKILVIAQFVATITMIIVTASVFRQIMFMNNQDLGMKIDKLMVLHTPGNIDERYDKMQIFKNEILTYPEVSAVSLSSDLPGKKNITQYGFSRKVVTDGVGQLFDVVRVDYDFANTFQFELLAGRDFSKEFGEEQRSLILNETAIKNLNFNSPSEAVGQVIHCGVARNLTIIGVVKDFHYESLKEVIRPVVFHKRRFPYMGYNYFCIQLNTQRSPKTIEQLKTKWNEIFPQSHFEYFFMDNYYDKQYTDEIQFGKIFSLFTGLVIFITCLGLLGLIVFLTSQRTKEIGIRKVNGATISEILTMLNKDFIKWVVIAFVVACPIAYYAMNKWLENFAYKTTLSWWIFVLAGVLALGIALLTVSWQSWRAATRNPVEALRYE